MLLFALLFSSRADGVMRTMNTEKLIQTLPHIQNQLDALLDFQVRHVRDRAARAAAAAEGWPSLLLLCVQPNSNELTNGVINSAFMLLFKDSIRLFAAYNEGVINMLGEPSALVVSAVMTVLSEACENKKPLKRKKEKDPKIFLEIWPCPAIVTETL